MSLCLFVLNFELSSYSHQKGVTEIFVITTKKENKTQSSPRTCTEGGQGFEGIRNLINFCK